jgi:elongation factor Ts
MWKRMSQTVHHIEGYVHQGSIGVLVEFRVESDFALRTDQFKTLAKDVAMHVAALQPSSLEDLLQQPFVKDPDRSVDQALSDVAAKIREQISIVRFVCWSAESEVTRPRDPPRPPANVIRFRGRNDV